MTMLIKQNIMNDVVFFHFSFRVVLSELMYISRKQMMFLIVIARDCLKSHKMSGWACRSLTFYWKIKNWDSKFRIKNCFLDSPEAISDIVEKILNVELWIFNWKKKSFAPLALTMTMWLQLLCYTVFSIRCATRTPIHFRFSSIPKRSESLYWENNSNRCSRYASYSKTDSFPIFE